MDHPLGTKRCAFHARESDAQDLIRRADGHRVGRQLLLRGAQDAVAMTFGVHAFLVDSARDRLVAPGTVS